MGRMARVILLVAMLGLVAIPSRPAAAQATPRYTLIDLGTFGGPNGQLGLPGQTMNAPGAVIFNADTSTHDPYAPNCFNSDCFVSLGGEWQRGVLTKLEALPGTNSAAPFSINDNGLIVGLSQNGAIDPVTGFPEARAVLWKDGKILNLGTLPGGTESNAFAVNDRGQATGPWSNDIPSPYSCQFFNCWGVETRGFVWQNGVMQDLGTLGGRETLPVFMNNRGQIAGHSYTNTTPNAATGEPTRHPFLWQNGHMQDLGSLGGTLAFPNGMNSHGQVVGQSTLAGDQGFHPFLWTESRGMQDLGTLGGPTGWARWVNDAAEVTGNADLPRQPGGPRAHHAFLWTNGSMTDLVPVEGALCSNGVAINNREQVVGSIGDCHGHQLGAMLWENGSAIDLSTLIAPSALHLTEAEYISDRGEIVAVAVLPNGHQHVVLLEPSHRFAVAQGSTIPAGGRSTTASFTAWFDSSAPGQGMVLFGSGPGCSGLVETATQDQGAGTATHTVTVTGNDLPGTIGDNGIVPGATYWYEVITLTHLGTEVDNNGGKCYSVTVPTM